MKRTIPIRFFAAGIAVVAFAAGCGATGDVEQDQGAETPAEEGSEATTVTFKTAEYSYDTPSEMEGGLASIVLDNTTGKESHEAEMTRLDEGKTLKDFQEALSQEGPPPPWAQPAGGPGPVLSGSRATYTAVLEPGTYVLACHVPGPDGQAHLEKGMVKEIEVTQGEAAELPPADATVAATEFDFPGTESLEAGRQTVRVQNQGQQPHHWALIALAPGKKAGDIMTFFAAAESGGPPAGPPPFTGFPGLVGTMAPGGEATRTLDLKPGTYAMACFIPDTDGTPHAAKGMLKEITVS